MNQEKEIYTRADIVQKLGIQSYILSLWEKEFGIATIAAADGQTLYTSQSYSQLKKIKELIYEKGHNLDTAKKMITTNKSEALLTAAFPLQFTTTNTVNRTLTKDLLTLQKQLIKLRKLL